MDESTLRTVASEELESLRARQRTSVDEIRGVVDRVNRYGYDDEGRVRRIGDDLVCDVADRLVDEIRVKRNGRAGAITRYRMDESGRVDARITLSTDGKWN